jgi:hypothetical protein
MSKALVFGEFTVLSVFYAIGTSIAVFWGRYETNRIVRNEIRMGEYDRTVKERTNFLRDLTVLTYGVAAGILVVLDILNWYDGPWWFPFAVNVPALIVGLYFLGQTRVIRYHQQLAARDDSKDAVTVKDETSGLRLVIALFIMYALMLVSAFLTVLVLRDTGWTSLPFIGGLAIIDVLPFAAWGMVVILSGLAPRS